MNNPTWPPRPPAPEEALRPTFEKAFMAHYTNGAHLLERFDTGHYRSEEARAAWHIAVEFHRRLTKAEPLAVVQGIDEYGPLLGWYSPWTNLPIGAKLYGRPEVADLGRQEPPQGAADCDVRGGGSMGASDSVEPVARHPV